MTFRQAHIDHSVVSFFQANLDRFRSLDETNNYLENLCGIKCFFANEDELEGFCEVVNNYQLITDKTNRREYGDFQTNEELTDQICKYLKSFSFSPEFIVEPTCGNGNFIVSCLKYFKTTQKILAVEIYKPYIWEAKFKVLKYFLNSPPHIVPDIEIIHANSFDFQFNRIAVQTTHYQTLIIGNPPWVTNAELSSISSNNFPRKTNFKKHNGYDAITGKSNFDIAEYIAILMIRNFAASHDGMFAFLMKNSVIKNIIYDQRTNVFSLSDIEKLNIDSKKEFNVSVKASLFKCRFKNGIQQTCVEKDFYTLEKKTVFGWHYDKFVSSVGGYGRANSIDGYSTFVWRQGIKHDCSKVMELKKQDDFLVNSLGEYVLLENDLVYGLLKSSDLKGGECSDCRKYTIITQRKLGEDTNYIKSSYPKTHDYLTAHEGYFTKRKSSIYKLKPPFSIFGIGEYSFAPYKVAISGLYKTTYFTLVLPDKNKKPLMLDDTCYFIGFNSLTHAKIAHYLLNSDLTQNFFQSIIFFDSKRPITKDVLMRIDIGEVYKLTDYASIQSQLLDIRKEDWESFERLLTTKTAEQNQLPLF